MHSVSAQKLTVFYFLLPHEWKLGGTCRAEIYVNINQVRTEVFVSMHRVQVKSMGIANITGENRLVSNLVFSLSLYILVLDYNKIYAQQNGVTFKFLI